MNFDVYCDEARPDLLSSQKPQAKYMLIGSLWLEADNREKYKSDIHLLRDKYQIGGEFKWQKASPSRFEFYRELIDWFYAQDEKLRFRCIAVDHEKVNLFHYHQSDQELGFYKFYYQMLHHWIMDFNDYTIFCDYKTNRHRNRLHVLKSCLASSNLSSSVSNVQAIKSRESVLMQLTDVLTGAASSRLNGLLKKTSTKLQIIKHLEQNLGRRIQHTSRSEQKFNVFVIDLQGGW